MSPKWTARRDNRLEATQAYYGEVLSTSEDLQTNACTTAESPSKEVRAALKKVSDRVLSKYYGCGLVYPDMIRGKAPVRLRVWSRTRCIRSIPVSWGVRLCDRGRLYQGTVAGGHI